MKRKIISTILTVALVIGLIFGVTGTSALAADEYINASAITAGADRLVETQNADGGWDWGDMAGVTSITENPSPKNTVGVTALGLIEGYRISGNQAYLDAAVLAAGYIEVNLLAGERVRGPALTFLSELADITGDATYTDMAVTAWETLLANLAWSADGTATAFGNYILSVRNSQLAMWDINLYVVGLMAIGKTADAVELATVTETNIDTYLDETLDYYSLALSGAIETYALTGVNTEDIAGLATALISLGNIDVQSTAYAAMALLRTNTGVTDYISYIVAAQDATGGFIDTDSSEYTEADSESIQALYDYAVVYKAAQDAQEQAELDAEEAAELAEETQWRETHHVFTMSGGSSKGGMTPDGVVTETVVLTGTYGNNQYKLQIDEGCKVSSRNLFFLEITDTKLVSSFGACKFSKPVTVGKLVNGEWVVIGTITEIVEDPGEGARMITGTAIFQ